MESKKTYHYKVAFHKSSIHRVASVEIDNGVITLKSIFLTDTYATVKEALDELKIDFKYIEHTHTTRTTTENVNNIIQDKEA